MGYGRRQKVSSSDLARHELSIVTLTTKLENALSHTTTVVQQRQLYNTHTVQEKAVLAIFRALSRLLFCFFLFFSFQGVYALAVFISCGVRTCLPISLLPSSHLFFSPPPALAHAHTTQLDFDDVNKPVPS